MARTLTFIHAADLHIGAPFRGLRALSPRWADRLMEAIPEAYDRIIDAAINNAVDFVVFAGDIFDTARASYHDYLRFFQGLDRLEEAGISSYLCTGNHDPFTSWKQDFFHLPKHARLFAADRPDFALYERDGQPYCILGGRGYYNKVWSSEENIAAGITRQAAERELGNQARLAPFGVGVLHTGLHLDDQKAPANPMELLHAGFDYWALGHIHRRYQNDEANPQLVFSGCVQGRDIKEIGPRGVYLVTLSEGAPNQIRFIPTASVVWNRLEVDVSGCTTIPEIVARVMREQFRVNGLAYCEEMISRITLTGSTGLHDLLQQPGVLEDVRANINESYSEFYCDALIDETTRPLDKDALRAEGLFPSVFLATSEALRADRVQEIAYLQDEFLRRNLPLPPAASMPIDKLAEEAENLVLDLLIRDGGSS